MILNTEAHINERTNARMRMAAGSRSGDLFLSTASRRGGLSFTRFYDRLNVDGHANIYLSSVQSVPDITM